VHDLFSLPDEAAVAVAYTLVAQANAEDWSPGAEMTDYIVGDTGL
jgi:hypothetical protein